MGKNWQKKVIMLIINTIMVITITTGSAFSKTIILGTSKITIPKGANIGTQVDRVIRDIAWKDSKYDIRVNPFRIAGKEDIVPYMEGYLSQQLVEFADAKIIGLAPTIAIFKNGEYYAADGDGNFPFRIDPSKTMYESAFINKKGFSIFVDSHGFNMIAQQAIRIHKIKKLDLVIACMDIESKANAALYLAKNGINAYGPCDRFGFSLLGYKKNNPNAVTIIGTAPIKNSNGGAVIGDQPVRFSTDETIVVQYTDRGYPDQYCDTPWRYFHALNKLYDLNLDIRDVYANVGEMKLVIEEAEKIDSKIIAIRVFNQQDADSVAKWLIEDRENRAILFHSAPYKPGYDLFFTFPTQTSFGDFSPIVKP